MTKETIADHIPWDDVNEVKMGLKNKRPTVKFINTIPVDISETNLDNIKQVLSCRLSGHFNDSFIKMILSDVEKAYNKQYDKPMTVTTSKMNHNWKSYFNETKKLWKGNK